MGGLALRQRLRLLVAVLLVQALLDALLQTTALLFFGGTDEGHGAWRVPQPVSALLGPGQSPLHHGLQSSSDDVL